MKKILIVLLAVILLFTGCEDKVIENFPINTLEANAGNDQQIKINQVHVLDGSNSKDGNNKALQYLWKVRIKPENSNATLTDATTVSPKFTADKSGTYVVELEIRNDFFADTDDVNIVVNDTTNSPVKVPVIISQDIQQDRILTNLFDDPAIPDYIVTEDVHVTGLLTIEPSVIIAFEAGKAMYVDYQGIIRAEGWVGNEVILTGKEKTPGYWKGLVINSPSELNLLKYVIIEYGGSNLADGFEAAANLALVGESHAKLSVLTSIIQHSEAYGLVLESGAAISVPASDILLKNNHRPALIPASIMKTGLGYVFDNDVNVIDVKGETVTELDEIFWHPAIDNSTPARTVPYRIMGKVLINCGLRILHGTHLMFDAGAEFHVGYNGYLIAKGTGDDPIRFHGAEPNETGYWKGIGVQSNNEMNELRYVEVYGAGSQAMDGFEQAAAIILDGDRQAKLNINNSKIGRSGGYGLYVENKAGLTDFTFNRLGYNTNAAMALPVNEVWKVNNMVAIEFSGNGHDGIEIISSVLLDATKQESVWPALYFGGSYLVSENLSIQKGLKLMPGVVLKFAEGKGIRVSGGGYLTAQGRDDLRVVFTGAAETKGFWNGIHFQSNSNSNILHNAVIEYAGKNDQSSATAA
ncbi:MAG: hypothetical protein PHH93_07815, partial [Prolixibacteraceae bacterium]|nr:hypothetical protein [Prolixibacteraceae bacterium]